MPKLNWMGFFSPTNLDNKRWKCIQGVDSYHGWISKNRLGFILPRSYNINCIMLVCSIRFGHLIRISPGRLPLEVFQARPTGRRPRGRPRTRWRDYISRLVCERLEIPQNKLENVAGEREVWSACWVCCPATRPRTKRMTMDGCSIRLRPEG